MLGKFGKMLRILGFDTLIAPPELSDTEILNQCLAENRFLITNDKLFHSRMAHKINSDNTEAKALLMDSTAPQSDQLKFFFDYFKVDKSFLADLDHPEKFFSRCTLCNGELRSISKEEVKDKINGGTYNSQDHFWICTSCKNIYWVGSHWNNIKSILEKI